MHREATESARAERIPTHCEAVSLRVGGAELSAFFPLLQRGVKVRAQVGNSLRQLLCEQFHIPQEYVTGRITTIFLDNSPLDDLDTTIREGARVTLSGAMPGLVGAMMRRSGFYAALRQGITHAATNGELKGGDGTIRLKLFNLLLPELAPLVLARGIVLQREELEKVLGDLSEATRMWITSSFPGELNADAGILLTVTFTE